MHPAERFSRRSRSSSFALFSTSRYCGTCAAPGTAAVRGRGRGRQLAGSGSPDCCSRLRGGRGLQRVAGSSLAATCSPLILQKRGDGNVAPGASTQGDADTFSVSGNPENRVCSGVPRGHQQREALDRNTLDSRCLLSSDSKEGFI